MWWQGEKRTKHMLDKKSANITKWTWKLSAVSIFHFASYRLLTNIHQFPMSAPKKARLCFEVSDLDSEVIPQNLWLGNSKGHGMERFTWSRPLPTSLYPFQKFTTIFPQNPKIRGFYIAFLLEAAPGAHFSPPSISKALQSVLSQRSEFLIKPSYLPVQPWLNDLTTLSPS